MKILIASVQVPFTRGGAELLVDSLQKELRVRGHQTDIISIPFIDQRKEVILEAIRAWQNIHLSEDDADLVITTKFPSYFISHPRKVLWLVHQHRQMYELLGTRFSDFHPNEKSEALRRLVVKLERQAFDECLVRSCISQNVCDRLTKYLGVSSISLPPPLPLQGRYKTGKKGDYILSVGRLCSIKRVDLILKSMPLIHGTLKLKIVGKADERNYEEYLRNEVAKHHLENRVEFLGRVSDEELIQLYADSFSVFYGPFDEDYGFVTLEALKSGKPVVTCNDSGGVLSFVEHERNGLLAEPTLDGVSRAVNRLLEDSALYTDLSSGTSIALPSWDHIIDTLLSSKKIEDVYVQ